MKKKKESKLKFRIAFIAARWHKDIVDSATESCLTELSALGIDTANYVRIYYVPGSLEIPLAAQKIIKTGSYDAVIAFGLIVDGGIYRHEFVAQTVLDGMMRVSLDTGIPILSCVLTPQKFDERNDKDIAFFRSHLSTKGVEVAQAAVQTIQFTTKRESIK